MTKKTTKAKLRPGSSNNNKTSARGVKKSMASNQVREYSKEWWEERLTKAENSGSHTEAMNILIGAISEYISHLDTLNYKSRKATKARIENGKKGGRPAGSKNKAPRSDKGIPRKHRTVEEAVRNG